MNFMKLSIKRRCTEEEQATICLLYESGLDSGEIYSILKGVIKKQTILSVLHRHGTTIRRKIHPIGERFGRLVVYEFSHIRYDSSYYYKCLCDCGLTTIVAQSSLRQGTTKSCGCLQKELSKERSPNLIGKVFCRLTVESLSITKSSSRGNYWNCVCSCGNVCVVMTSSLNLGRVRSCGCLQREIVRSQRGINSPSYKKSRSLEDRLNHRDYIEYEEWRREIKRESDCVCIKCKKRYNYKQLIAHHIESYTANPELRLTLSNGACLCKSCHIKFHKLYTTHNNTRKQFIEFMNIK